MTVKDFSEEVVSNLDIPAYQIDPITLLIITTIVSTVVGYYVQKWLDKINNKKSFNMIDRWQMKRKLASEFQSQAPKLKGQFLDPVFDSLIKIAEKKDANQVKAIMASCKPV